jgi:hypothetical protein
MNNRNIATKRYFVTHNGALDANLMESIRLMKRETSPSSGVTYPHRVYVIATNPVILGIQFTSGDDAMDESDAQRTFTQITDWLRSNRKTNMIEITENTFQEQPILETLPIPQGEIRQSGEFFQVIETGVKNPAYVQLKGTLCFVASGNLGGVTIKNVAGEHRLNGELVIFVDFDETIPGATNKLAARAMAVCIATGGPVITQDMINAEIRRLSGAGEAI